MLIATPGGDPPWWEPDCPRAWAHWQQNREGETVGRPISYQELVNRTGVEFLPRNAFQH